MFDLHIEKKTTTLDSSQFYDLLVIGGGPAGLNAALYAKRKGLNVAILTKDIGGQLHNTTEVDNYLGFQLIKGDDLSSAFLTHLESLQVPIYRDILIKSLTYQNPFFQITLASKRVYQAKTVVLATGGSPRQLGVPGEVTYQQKGVSYCTTCDAPFFKDKHIIVAGGGNSAAEAILDLVPWAKKITLVHRSQWRADDIVLQKVLAISNLSIHLQSQILSVEGNDHFTHINVLDKNTNQAFSIEADGLFIEIGTIPNNELVKGLVELNQQGEVIVDHRQMTSLPGLFAAGDVTHFPHKQIITAVAQGAIAALEANQYINYKEKK
ncbi:MAG: FAD-dependent oxidoreductase [Bacilli bacterium]